MTKISDASLVGAATGAMKMPTGEVGDLAINVEQIKTYVFTGTAGNTIAPNLIFAGPATGPAAAPTFRALVAADLPSDSAAYWKTAGITTLTAANTITGSSSNTLKFIFPSLGVTQTNGAGIWLANTTAASLGSQQISPSLVLEGFGWETTGGTSQSVKVSTDVLPVQNLDVSSIWRLRSSINGSAYANFLTVSSGGVLTLTIAGGNTVLNVNGQGTPVVQIGGAANGMNPVDGSLSTSLASTAFGLNYVSNGGTTGTINAYHNFSSSSAPITSWATTYRHVRISNSAIITPSSGAGGWTNLEITPEYNITGTASGTLRGVYVNPTVIATTSSIVNKAWEHTSGYVQWNSVLSPAQITSNQNDYNPTGLNNSGAPHGASILRVTTDASRNITSIVGGATGRLLVIANVGSNNVVIKDDDGATGTAANRFQLSSDLTLLPEQSSLFWYDGTTSRWRSTSVGITGILSPTNGGTGVANNAASTITISGNFDTTFTVTASTNVTLPTSGTLVNSTQAWLASSGVVLTGTNTISGAQTVNFTNTETRFLSGVLKVRNPADTFSYTFTGGAIGADRTILFPVITGTRNLVLSNGIGTAGNIPFWETNQCLTLSPNLNFVTNRLSGTTLYLTLSAGTATAGTCPLVMTTGTVLGTAISGGVEYNNTFHMTNSDATRRHVVLAPNTTKVTAGAPYANSGYVVMNVGGTDFNVMVTG